MQPGRTFLTVLTILLISIIGLVVAGWAAEPEAVVEPGRVPLPAIAEAPGESCAADTEFMRRNHMSLLKHKRDETVHEGIRTQQFSLEGCINCHVVTGPDEQPVTAASPEHFCSSCHDYVAVKVDCFQCHASRPEPGVLPADHRPLGAAVGAHGIACE